MADQSPADDVLIAYGDACATITPLIKARFRTLQSGAILAVRTDDPASREALEAWSRLTGHEIVRVEQEEGHGATFFVRKK